MQRLLKCSDLGRDRHRLFEQLQTISADSIGMRGESIVVVVFLPGVVGEQDDPLAVDNQCIMRQSIKGTDEGSGYAEWQRLSLLDSLQDGKLGWRQVKQLCDLAPVALGPAGAVNQIG